MLRLNKLTDYAIVIMAYLATQAEQKACNAKEISQQTGVAYPTASKLLKRLAQHKLLCAQRGIKGGYQLACPAQHISLERVIQTIEGPIALTECSQGQRRCIIEKQCTVQANWRRISAFIQTTLNRLSVADLIQPLTLAPFEFRSNQPSPGQENRA